MNKERQEDEKPPLYKLKLTIMLVDDGARPSSSNQALGESKTSSREMLGSDDDDTEADRASRSLRRVVRSRRNLQNARGVRLYDWVGRHAGSE